MTDKKPSKQEKADEKHQLQPDGGTVISSPPETPSADECENCNKAFDDPDCCTDCPPGQGTGKMPAPKEPDTPKECHHRYEFKAYGRECPICGWKTKEPDRMTDKLMLNWDNRDNCGCTDDQHFHCGIRKWAELYIAALTQRIKELEAKK